MPRRAHLLLLTTLLPAALPAQTTPWQMETSGTTASLRGVHAVGGGVVWASGTGGTVLRTEDAGYMWQTCAMPPGAEKLDFRAIWAFDANTAVVMSSGPGDASRLYKTTDGCSHWTLLLTNPDPNGFWDGLIFLDARRGFVIGDATPASPQIAPVEGAHPALRIRATDNAGRTWTPVIDGDSSPLPGSGLYALPDEGFFAASNSTMAAKGAYLWLGTNQSRTLRIALSNAPFQAETCSGAVDVYSHACAIPWRQWTLATVPLAKGATAGIFSLAFRDPRCGLAVGGDYTKPDERLGTAAMSTDGGQHWTAARLPPGGYRSAVAWDPDHHLWITVGPNGSDLSRDDGRTWQPLEHAPVDTGKGGEWNALSLPWVVGPNGRIAKLNAEALPKAPSTAR